MTISQKLQTDSDETITQSTEIQSKKKTLEQLVHMSRKKIEKTVLSLLLETESFGFGLFLKQNKTFKDVIVDKLKVVFSLFF